VNNAPGFWIMTNENFVIFDSSFPDDTVWNGDGNPETPGGRAICDFMKVELSENGWTCSETKPYCFYGWSFDVSSASGGTMVLLQYPGPWLLIVTRHPSLWKRLRGIPDDRVESRLLECVHQLLAKDSRISVVKRLSRADYFRAKT